MLVIIIPIAGMCGIIYLFIWVPLSLGSKLGQFHSAARDGDITSVEHLLKNGVNPDSRSQFRNWTALHAASDSGNVGVAKLLIAKGAQIDPIDNELNTPLHLTAISDSGKSHPRSTEPGRNAIAILLMGNGANVNSRNAAGNTALHDAVVDGNLELVKILVAGHADPEAKNNNGYSPIDYARQVWGSDSEIIKTLR